MVKQDIRVDISNVYPCSRPIRHLKLSIFRGGKGPFHLDTPTVVLELANPISAAVQNPLHCLQISIKAMYYAVHHR